MDIAKQKHTYRNYTDIGNVPESLNRLLCYHPWIHTECYFQTYGLKHNPNNSAWNGHTRLRGPRNLNYWASVAHTTCYMLVTTGHTTMWCRLAVLIFPLLYEILSLSHTPDQKWDVDNNTTFCTNDIHNLANYHQLHNWNFHSAFTQTKYSTQKDKKAFGQYKPT